MGANKISTQNIDFSASTSWASSSLLQGNGVWASANTLGFYKNTGNSFGGNAIIGLSDNFTLSIITNNVTRIVVANSGEIGIGNSAVADTQLDVFKNSFTGTKYIFRARSTGITAIEALDTGNIGLKSSAISGWSVVIGSTGSNSVKMTDSGFDVFSFIHPSGGEGVFQIFSSGNAKIKLRSDTATPSFINNGAPFGIGISAPTAVLMLGAGTSTAGTAPLKFTSGTNLTTAEAGAIEYNGTNLFFTRTGTTRESVVTAVNGTFTGIQGAVLTFASSFYGTGGTSFLSEPDQWLKINVGGVTYGIPAYSSFS